MDAFSTSVHEELERLEQDDTANVSPWLRSLQRKAAGRIKAQGLPTTAEEAWKYTNLASLAKTGFTLSEECHRASVSADAFNRIPLAADCTMRVVFVNGGFRSDLSTLATLPPGLGVENIRAALNTENENVNAALGRASESSPIFTDLNTALLHDGIIVDIGAEVSVDAPLHLVFIGTTGDSRLLRLPRIFIRGRRRSSINIIEEYVSSGQDHGLTNSVTEITVDEGATVHHHRLQVESTDASHIGRLSVEIGDNGTFVSDSIVFGADLTRVDVEIALIKRGARCRLNGLFVAGDHQHIDHHTLIDHIAGDTHSEELYRGILDDRSRGVFNGRVIVRKDAQKISAKQTSNNLLLSRQAEIDTKPELEIYADDVTCAHGATVGELDDAALFYLRSRGVGEKEARALLTYAFAQKVVENIPLEGVRTWVENRFLGHRDYSQLGTALESR